MARSFEQRPLRLLWLGTYERDYTNAGLDRRPARARGRSARMSQASVGQGLSAWLQIALRQSRIGDIDAVIAGYPHQPDALPAAAVARRRGVPLVVDAMIHSGAPWPETARASARAWDRRWLASTKVTMRCADVAIADTDAHARLYHQRFRVLGGADRRGQGGSRGCGCSDLRVLPGGEPCALYYGKLAPLHGLETILEAARQQGTPALKLIGDGQLGGWLAGELRRQRPAGTNTSPGWSTTAFSPSRGTYREALPLPSPPECGWC